MSFKLAFDKNLGLELFVFKHMYYDKSKKIFFSSYNTEHMIDAIGSFLLIFLNTDFEDDEDCRSFVFWFCFENLYYRKYPKIKKANQDLSTHLKLSFSEFNKELDKIVKEYKEEFLYLKYTLLKNLRLPYDTNFFRRYDDELELTQEDIQNISKGTAEVECIEKTYGEVDL